MLVGRMGVIGSYQGEKGRYFFNHGDLKMGGQQVQEDGIGAEPEIV